MSDGVEQKLIVWDLRITGLLGILVEAKRKNLVAAVKPLMDAVIATSEFRVSSALYHQILEIVNEAR